MVRRLLIRVLTEALAMVRTVQWLLVLTVWTMLTRVRLCVLFELSISEMGMVVVGTGLDDFCFGVGLEVEGS